MTMSDHDAGFAAGWICATNEALRIVKSHIDRLEPGKQQSIRNAMQSLEASMHSIMIDQQQSIRTMNIGKHP